jgi:hypothetical protein
VDRLIDETAGVAPLADDDGDSGQGSARGG